MIRKAGLDDIERLVHMAETTHSESVHSYIPFVHADTADIFEKIISSPDGVCLIGRKCYYAGVLSPFHFNLGVRRLVEVGYDGGPLKSLLAAVIDAGRAGGAVEVAFAVEATKRAQAMARLLRMNGGDFQNKSIVWRL